LMQEKLPKKIVASVVNQLYQIRKEKKLSHEKVAQLSELHRSSISLIEAGKTQATLLTLLKICQALECDLSRLLAKAEKENR
jgi:transcriptional regulator with XRE-family HTH domain